MARSPISAPDIVDKRPVPTTAVARATDETLWALIELLIEGKIIKPDALAAKLGRPLSDLRRTGTLASQEDEDRFATSLAPERVVSSLESLSANID